MVNNPTVAPSIAHLLPLPILLAIFATICSNNDQREKNGVQCKKKFYKICIPRAKIVQIVWPFCKARDKYY